MQTISYLIFTILSLFTNNPTLDNKNIEIQQVLGASTTTATTTLINADKVYSYNDLLKISGPNPNQIPLGDNKYTTDMAKKGYIYLCNARKGDDGGAFNPGSWIRDGYWYPNEKVHIDGEVSWKNATFKNLVSGLKRILSGNGLPTSHTTGTFPVSRSDDAYNYDRNPNTIKTQTLNQTFSTTPTFSTKPNCMGGEVGVMLSGVPLFNGFDANLRDAVAYELQDSCSGHPQVAGEYHYHSQSACFSEESITKVLGFALDGFPITGGQVAKGKYLTTEDLDICHGLTSEIVLDGKKKNIYHYVLTKDFPYSVSCFRGKPVSMQVMKNNGEGGMQGNQAGKPMTPPQAALEACSGKSENTTCSVQTPNGNLSGTCKNTPDGKYFACIPAR